MLPARQRIGAAASILIYALMTLVAWDRVGVIEVFPDLFSQIAMWVVFGFFVFSIVLNAISRSKAERYTMVPVSIVLSLLCFFIAMGYGTAAMAI